MALARTYSVALVGVRGHLIEVEADIASGLPATILVGLPDTALREARDRIRAAIVNSGEDWPSSKITVGLSPAALPKRGSGFDLAIAVAILAAAGTASAAARMATAIAKSNPEPRLGSVAGERPTVILEFGQHSPLFTIAARIRSRASRRAVSGRPTKMVAGSPLAMSASTSIRWPRTPTSATE